MLAGAAALALGCVNCTGRAVLQALLTATAVVLGGCTSICSSWCWCCAAAVGDAAAGGAAASAGGAAVQRS
jgi:hypothetical protein